jgi:predicted acyl esterase
VKFDAKTGAYFRSNILYPFFEQHLKGKNNKGVAVYAFETGSNVWRNYPAWPPQQAKTRTLYLAPDGKLLDSAGRRRRVRRIRGRPAQARALHGLSGPGRAQGIHGGRPTLCRLASRRADLSQRDSGRM